MKVTVVYRNVSAHPLRFEAWLYTKGFDGQPVHDKAGIVRADGPADPGGDFEIEFLWTYAGHPEHYVWKAPPVLSCKFQLRKLAVDGKSMLKGTDGEGMLPVTEGLFT